MAGHGLRRTRHPGADDLLGKAEEPAEQEPAGDADG
jgi:hypothetical protein